jgi:hypothetical protein
MLHIAWAELIRLNDPFFSPIILITQERISYGKSKAAIPIASITNANMICGNNLLMFNPYQLIGTSSGPWKE